MPEGGIPLLAIAAAAALASGTLDAGPLHAQGASELDDGRFEIRTGDRRIGTETFAIRREGSRLRAAGRVSTTGVDGGTVNVILQTGPDQRPEQYRYVSSVGPIQGVEATFERGRLRLHLTTDEGERWTELVAEGPTAVLEDGLAHHFFLLFRQLPEDPSGASLQVVIPSRSETATARVRGGAQTTVQVGEERRQATRYEVEVDGRTYGVWSGAEGRILRVEAVEDGRVWARLPER